MELSFTKMQGCANDYIYLDCRTAGVPENIAALSEKLSRRHFSIGADGIICICAPRTAGADAVAAHPALAAVGVEDAHHGIRPGGARCANADLSLIHI